MVVSTQWPTGPYRLTFLRRKSRIRPAILSPSSLLRFDFSATHTLGDEDSVQSDIGFEQFGNGTSSFCHTGQLFECRLICTRNPGFKLQMDGSNGIATLNLLQRNRGRGFHPFCGELCLTQNQREGHGEAAGVCSREQLLRIGTGHPFETAGKTIGVVLQGTAPCGYRALAVLDATLPLG